MREPMIVSDPKVMMGKPVVAGTRVTVDLIPEKLGGGESARRPPVRGSGSAHGEVGPRAL
jgi:hypothetical protein